MEDIPTKAGGMAKASQCTYVLIRNIPKDFKSFNLRRFFTDFVEAEKMECFHYRHRPEVKTAAAKSGGDDPSVTTKDTRCCLVRFSGPSAAKEFASRYNGRHWTDEKGVDLCSRCIVTRVKMATEEEDKTEAQAENKEEDKRLKEGDVMSMVELRPPAAMPRGNVGTSTQYFLDAIRECRLPAAIIGKLKLEFPRSRRRRKYGSVPYEYKDAKRRKKGGDSRKEEEDQAGKQCHSEEDGDEGMPPPPAKYLDRSGLEKPHRSGPDEEAAKEESGSDDDDDTCEEWERHEALHDDVQARRAGNLGDDLSQQPGTKERLYEEEMEVTWDKGSSGLVFYTDAQVWKEMEGDFDQQTTDDWDVDMSAYYEDGAGDLDARDGLDARRAMFRRDGSVVESAFKSKKGQKGPKSFRRRLDDGEEGGPSTSSMADRIGKFEKHTRGFGRKIMESQGWKDGQGLGPSERPGMAEALENEGQVGKAGLGFYGEKILNDVAPRNKRRVRESIRDVLISTAYDKPEETDPSEALKRRNPQMYLSHRKK